MQCRGHYLLKSAETPNVNACSNWRHHTIKSEVGPVCRGCVWPSVAYRQNLLSSLKTTERHSILLSTLSRHHSSRDGVEVWEPGQKHTWSESSCKQTVPNGPWWHNRCNMCPNVFPGHCLCGHHCSHNAPILTCVCTTRNLVYSCENVPQITPKSSSTPPIHRYFVPNMCSIRRYVHPVSRRLIMRLCSNG